MPAYYKIQKTTTESLFSGHKFTLQTQNTIQMYLQHESDENHTANDIKKSTNNLILLGRICITTNGFSRVVQTMYISTTMTMFCSLAVVMFLEKDSETNEKSNKKKDH